MSNYLYEIALHLVALFSFPVFLYQYIFKKKYRKNVLQRFGKGFPRIQKRGKIIWLHAVSVGEIKAVVSFLQQIKNIYPEYQILISSITETGHREAKRAVPFADWHVYLPFDFSYVVKPIVKAVAPDIVILSETDYWPNFLHTAKKMALFAWSLMERFLLKVLRGLLLYLQFFASFSLP